MCSPWVLGVQSLRKARIETYFKPNGRVSVDNNQAGANELPSSTKRKLHRPEQRLRNSDAELADAVRAHGFRSWDKLLTWDGGNVTKFCKLVRHAETELPLTHAAFREGREKTRAAAPERKRVLEKQSREKRQKANKQATQLNWNQYELESVRTGISMTGTSMNWNQYELEPV